MTSLRYLALSVAVTVTALLLPSLHAVEDEKSSLPIAIVVHGGAGSVDKKWEHKEGLREAGSGRIAS
ncbi:MAG: hypothetical protein ABF384_08020 [Verrucomicrobiales bacterium]|jgi:hypothetical protein|nr:hypothetical protein [Verrucomicrobiales bacterium]